MSNKVKNMDIKKAHTTFCMILSIYFIVTLDM